MKLIHIAFASSLFLHSCSCDCDEQQIQSETESTVVTLTEDRAKEVILSAATNKDIGRDYFVYEVEDWSSGLQNMGDGEQWLFAKLRMRDEWDRTLSYHLKFIFKLVQNDWVLCDVAEGNGEGIPLAIHGWGEQLYVSCSE